MTVESPSEPPPRTRPVADAPVEAVLARTDELARRWAVAQILVRPLERIAEVPLEALASAGPTLCETLVRALASDRQLELLARGEAPGVALETLLATSEPRALVADVDALRAILWEALLAALDQPPTRLVVDLADRLASVCATALATALAARPVGLDTPIAPPAGASRPARHPRVLYATSGRAPGRGGAVLIDELDAAPGPLVDDVDLSGVGQDVASTRPRARPWDTPLDEGQPMRVTRVAGAPRDADERR